MWVELKGKDGLTVKHIPYGYKIIDGKAEVDEDKAKQVKELFEFYLEGHSLASISKRIGLKRTHPQIGRMLEKAVYLGDEFYPTIISKEQFELAQEERLKRATKLGRLNRAKSTKEIAVLVDFKMAKPTKEFDDHFTQAEYLYGLIETEVKNDDG